MALIMVKNFHANLFAAVTDFRFYCDSIYRKYIKSITIGDQCTVVRFDDPFASSHISGNYSDMVVTCCIFP